VCLDKNLMRARFRERIGPGSGARFHEVTSEPDLVDWADRLGYPVFLQPTNVSASMWASRNDSTDVLVRNYRTILDEVPRYYERLGQREKRLGVVLAEYLEGSNTSIDCVVDREGRVTTTPVVDVLTGRDIGIDDYHHFARILPSRLTEEEERELAQLAEEGVGALEMRSSAAHVEFIGQRLGEIAARPGGNRPRILELAYGLDELYAYYQVLRGEAPRLSPTHKRGAAIITPFPAKEGILREIRYLDRLTRLPGYLYHEVRTKPGERVGMAKGGHRAPLYIELCSPDPEDVHQGVDEIASWRDLYEVG
jgi:biotin carboxylase